MASKIIEGLKALSRLRAFSPNLFEVTLFGAEDPPSQSVNYSRDPNTGKVQPSIYTDQPGDLNSNPEKSSFKATLYCTAVDIPTPTLKVERHPLTRAYYVTGYNFIEDVTITWQEDQSMSVWNYHRDWIDKFYDRFRDMFIIGPLGKKRSAILTIQQISVPEDNNQNDFDPILDDLHSIELHGIVPKSIYPVKLSWDDDSSKSIGIQIRYSLDYLKYNFKADQSVKKKEWEWMSQDDWSTVTSSGKIL